MGPPVYTLTSTVSRMYLGVSVSQRHYFQNFLYFRKLKNVHLLFELLNKIGE